ncbi:3Beta_HSD domain-containing protein [Fusarium acuminatum]|uniref:3Beta_HSD domain-containing protein n=1 Tax=Fusarium acuminatum TaxID=5515 RepID=A0ABZ2XAC6_9HYPO
MAQNILITGAAGYIGGSVMNGILSHNDQNMKNAKIFAAVRSQDHIDKISKLERVRALNIDLTDKTAIEREIELNKIDLVVHTAASWDPKTSVASMFTEEGGWPYGEVRDTDAILDKEREIGLENPVRKTNISLADESKAQGVETFNMAVPMTYGTGSGEVRKLSVNIPALVRTSVKLKTVYKFDNDSCAGTVHIDDLTDLYVLLVNKIVNQEPIAVDNDRYFFVVAHREHWWKVMNKIAKNLYARGLVTEPTPKIWPNYDIAAESLGFPRKFIVPMCMTNGDLVPVNGDKLGWKPKWDSEEKFLDLLDQEIDDILNLDTAETSLFNELLKH